MTLLDVTDALDGLTVPLTVQRSAAGSYSNGRWSEGTSTTLSIDACVQVLSPKEMLRLPENQRQQGARKLWTTTLLQSADVSTGRRADRFSYLGETWEVLSVGDWNDLGGYYECVVTKDGQ